jgi:hypothetical protein
MRALFYALVGAAAASPPRGVPRDALRPDVHASVRARHARVMAAWPAPRRDAAAPTISPVDFGADPTGVADSSAAFSRAMGALLNRTRGKMAAGIADLGGAVLDLGGGTYSLSAPLVVPQFFGNMRIIDGTMRARAGFPADAFVLQIGASPCSAGQQASCNENIGLSGLTIDGSHIAAGALSINSTMGATLDSSSAVFGFERCGIAIYGGHETMITETWVAAYFWDNPLKARNQATGICIDGNDHYVTNVIVYSALVGIAVNGAANLFQGVHTWNTMTSMGGVGILNNATSSRFEGCYFDYTDLRLVVAESLSITSSFFLGNAQLEFRAPRAASAVRGVYVAGSVYSMTTLPPIKVNETEGAWTNVTDLIVEGTVWGTRPTAQPRAGVSRASKTWAGACNNASIVIDFSDVLVFPSTTVATRTLSGLACRAQAPQCGVRLAVEQPDPRAVAVLCMWEGPDVQFTATIDQSADSAVGVARAEW